MSPALLQWGGCVTGVLGALLLAWRSAWSGWGFVVYLASNGFWLAYGIKTGAPGLVAMQVVFTLTSLLGIWRWLVVDRANVKEHMPECIDTKLEEGEKMPWAP